MVNICYSFNSVSTGCYSQYRNKRNQSNAGITKAHNLCSHFFLEYLPSIPLLLMNFSELHFSTAYISVGSNFLLQLHSAGIQNKFLIVGILFYLVFDLNQTV